MMWSWERGTIWDHDGKLAAPFGMKHWVIPGYPFTWLAAPSLPARWKAAPTPDITVHNHLHDHWYGCSEAGVVSDRRLVFSKIFSSPLLKDHHQPCLFTVSLQDALLALVPLDVWWRQQPMA